MYLYLFLLKLRELNFSIDLHLIRTDYDNLIVCHEFAQFRNITSEFQFVVSIKRKIISRLLRFNGNIPLFGWSTNVISSKKLRLAIDKYEFVIVNYVWNYKSVKLFNCKKILFVHDSFLNRNEKVKQKWVSFSLNDLKQAYSVFTEAVYSNYSEFVTESVYFSNTFYCGLPFYEVSLNKTKMSFSDTIGFIGSANILNLNTLKYFVAHLDKFRNFHDYNLIVAGSISKQIKDMVFYDFLKVIGEIINVESFYNQVYFVLSLIGPSTGIKIKDIEALAYGKIIICDDDTINCFPPIEGIKPTFIHISNLKSIFNKKILHTNMNVEYYTLYQRSVSQKLNELFNV